MSIKLSQLWGIDIYNDQAKYLGKVHDIIMNMEEGTIERITLEPLRITNKSHAEKLLKEKSILYNNVISSGDIIIVQEKGNNEPAEKPKEKNPYLPPKRHRIGK
ncbi:MAG: PRC-barrel domain-containing protein [Candidatus Diapherotrites archaeon]|nr:PRC-barrel domain-containing protein [Candidatus Diapherotrites archaeon]